MKKIITTIHAVERARERGALPHEQRHVLSNKEVSKRLASLWYEEITEPEQFRDPDVPELPTLVKRVQVWNMPPCWLVARPNYKTGETIIVSVLTEQQKANNQARRWKPWSA